jgi:hypothetical protein
MDLKFFEDLGGLARKQRKPGANTESHGTSNLPAADFSAFRKTAVLSALLKNGSSNRICGISSSTCRKNRPMAQELMLEPQSLSAIMEQADRAGYLMSEVVARSWHLRRASRRPPSMRPSWLPSARLIAARSCTGLARATCPLGINDSGNRREFSARRSAAWIREYRAKRLRPEGAEASLHFGGQLQGRCRQDHHGDEPGARADAQGPQRVGDRLRSPGLVDDPLRNHARHGSGRVADDPSGVPGSAGRASSRPFKAPTGTTWIWCARPRCCSLLSLDCPRGRCVRKASSSGTR